MSKTLRSFFDALSEQEKLFQAELASDSLGIALRTAVNELDWYAYNMARSGEPNLEQQEQFYILSIGVARLIKLGLDARPSYDVPVIMFPRTRELTISALECASGLGMIQHGRRVAQTVSWNRGEIEQTGETEFVITLPEKIYDEDSLEKSILEHYTAQSAQIFEEIVSSDRFKELGGKVSGLLSQLVYPFAEHFIGYGGDPILDLYFFGIARHRLQCQRGFDSFKFNLKFGGVEFQKYILALDFVTGIAIRHERFAEALAEKEEKSRIENLLTISVEVEPFVESLREAVNFLGQDVIGFTEASPEQAVTIFKVLSIDRESTELLDRPGCALPPFIRVSDSGAIRCQTGALHYAMQFLLDALRWHFPNDYSKNQATRETSMQAAVERVMTEAYDNLLFRRNVRLRYDGRVLTDVDLVVAEPRTGLVLFFQLKHQDMYGADLHAEAQRKERLQTQIEKWNAATSEWLDASDRESVSSATRLPKGFPEPSVKRIILTRHFAGNLHSDRHSNPPLSSNWEVFFNAVELAKQKHGGAAVSDVLGHIEKSMSESAKRTHVSEPESEWIIRDLKFTTRQAGNFRSDHID